MGGMWEEFQSSSDNFGRPRRCHCWKIKPKFNFLLASRVGIDDPRKDPNVGYIGVRGPNMEDSNEALEDSIPVCPTVVGYFQQFRQHPFRSRFERMDATIVEWVTLLIVPPLLPIRVFLATSVKEISAKETLRKTGGWFVTLSSLLPN